MARAGVGRLAPFQPLAPAGRQVARVLGIWGKMMHTRLCGTVAGLLLAAVPVAALAQECAPMSRHFVFCDDGTDWAEAEWEQSGDGATIVLGDLRLDFTEDWMGRDDAQDAGTALTALLNKMTADARHEELSRDSFPAGELSVSRVIQTVSVDSDPPVLRATMIAGAGAGRIVLRLEAPADLPVEEIDRRAREVAGLVRLAEGG